MCASVDKNGEGGVGGGRLRLGEILILILTVFVF